MARLLLEHPWTRPLFRALVSCPRALLRAVRAGPDDVGQTIPDSALLHRARGPIFSLQRRPPRHPAGARRTEIASLPPRAMSAAGVQNNEQEQDAVDRKSTRLNSSH